MNSHRDLPEIPELTSQEWLLTLGNGGYASGTVNGPRTRSYHGLMVAAFEPPLDRILVLSHVDATWIVESGEAIDFACHVYGDHVVHPKGFLLLTRFERQEGLEWTWKTENITLKLHLSAMGGNRISLRYVIETQLRGHLRLRPFVCWRGHHGGESPRPTARSVPGGTEVSFSDNRALVCFRHEETATLDYLLHENFNYVVEEDRGLSHFEDMASPCYMEWSVSPGTSTYTLEVEAKSGQEKDISTNHLRPHQLENSLSPTGILKRAVLDFLIQSPGMKSPGIIAGYPWFNEWGRDTMIALPGVVAARGSDDLAKEILLAWTGCLKDGLLPNRLAEGEGECGYNSADAPLWYVRMVRRYYHRGLSHPDLLVGALQVVDSYLRGTNYRIFVDPTDGLLAAGDPKTQLTWMDACFEGHCFTPRNGKCVELNSLFFEALNFAQEIAPSKGARATYESAAKRLKSSFEEKFFDGKLGLWDCLEDGSVRLRPNQLLAIGCPDNLLDEKKKKLCFLRVRDHLLTPYGIRSLDPRDPEYRGRYEGGPEERDGAYHQGTVWMWLMGPFIDAHFSVFGRSSKQKREAEAYLGSCLKNLRVGMQGQLNEIFDGDFPFTPRGAPAQVWSASEIERVLHDWDLDRNRVDHLCHQDS